jgi:hypothetical protein
MTRFQWDFTLKQKGNPIQMKHPLGFRLSALITETVIPTQEGSQPIETKF